MVEISVIVPAYNAEKYLENAVKSILKQSFSDFELILVNDGSLDKTLDIMNALAKEDKRITVINKENEGVGFARNAGMRAAKGKYLYFADADDVLHPQLLAFLHRACEKEQADFAGCAFVAVRDDAMPEMPFYNEMPKLDVFENPLKNMCLKHRKFVATVWNKLYRRDSLRGLVFADYNCGEDLYFNILAFRKFSKGVFVPLTLYYYVMSTGSITRKEFNFDKLRVHMQIFEQFKVAFEREPENWKIVKSEIVNRRFYGLAKAVSELKDKEKKQRLKAKWLPQIKDFMTAGIIGTEGFSLRKRLTLFFFLHF